MIHLVVPHDLDDPGRPSGGDRYDRELADALRSLGNQVEEHPVRGTWTSPADAELARTLAGLPDDAAVLVDGLVGLAGGPMLTSESDRLRLWLLVHLPLALAGGSREQEQQALAAATGVVTTSDWTRRWLLQTYDLAPARVHVARPGVRPSAPATGTTTGAALLCVGAVVPAKGADVLVAALAELADLSWTCRIVGPLDRDPAFVDRLRRQIRDAGLAGRIELTGPLSPVEVRAAYDASDLLVLPTRLEMFGMVLTEALAHGLPVIASDTGGVREAVGVSSDGTVPGLLVPPGDADALASAIRGWLEDSTARDRWRAAAADRRARLPGWATTARAVAAALGVTPRRRLRPGLRGALRYGVAGAVLLVLVARLGTGPFVRAFEQITPGALLAALLVTALTTWCVAWRWSWVARRLGLDLELRAAVPAYYRSQLLNQLLPGGVLGDVDRAVRHGDHQAALGRAARAVVWERVLGQVGLVALTALAAVGLPAALRGPVAWLLLACLGIVAVIALLVRGSGRARGLLRGDLRRLASSDPSLPVALSVAAACGHLLVLLVALRTAGVDVPPLEAAPLLVLVLLASSVPLSIAGWGPREGAAAGLFAAAGWGAADGVTVATTYGILSLVAATPGVLVLAWDLAPRRSGVRTT